MGNGRWRGVYFFNETFPFLINLLALGDEISAFFSPRKFGVKIP